MLANQTLLRLVEFALRFDDQEEVVARLGNNPIGDRTWDHDVVALFEAQRPEIRFDAALAPVDEVQLVAVGVAEVERHGLGAARDVQPDVMIAEKSRWRALGVSEIGWLQVVEIEAMRPELALESDPAGGRMRVVEVRGFSVEALAPVLFLERPIRQPHMGLAGGLALLERIHALGLLLPVYGGREFVR